jgi:hypothetical protein
MLNVIGFEDYASGINGSKAIKLKARFNVTLVEESNPSNILDLTNCEATFGFVVPE